MPMSSSRGLDAASCLFRGFADPTRLAIVQLLAERDLRVVDLTDRLGLAQSTVSQHLACLRDCDLVAARQEGRASVYSLTEPAVVRGLLEAAEVLLAATGDAVALCATYGAPRAAEAASR